MAMAESSGIKYCRILNREVRVDAGAGRRDYAGDDCEGTARGHKEMESE